MFKTAEYERGYNAGYRQALLDAIKERDASRERFERRQRTTPLRIGDCM